MKQAAALCVVLVGCSAALHEPSPVAVYAPGHGNGRSAEQLEREGDAAWARRDAAAAQDLYLDAAVADGIHTAPLLAAMRALSYRLEHAKGIDKGALAREGVQLGQLCQRRAPADAWCDYRLAIALGQDAREHTSEGKDAVNHMVALLKKTVAAAPGIDDAGPHRVLALLYLRAPGWPTGPGDPDAGLTEAKAAVAAAPTSADNQLALGEALAANDARGDAHAAYQAALERATAAQAAGDPDAAAAIAAARAGLGKTQ